MTLQSEAQLESALVTRLSGMGWLPVALPDETSLWDNLRAELGAFNGLTFSDDEFTQVRNHLSKGSVFDKAHTLRDRFRLTRDDGSDAWIRFLNSEHWCRNRYQVATQIGIQGRRKNRYDVTLLINGLPLGQVELKRPGVELKEAFDQINRYQKDSFAAAGGLFQFVQVFMISNGVNTRYYANNRHQSFKQTFTWSTIDNEPINRLEAFTDVFLDTCQFSKLIAKYIVLHESDKILMVLRPYQYFAAEKILERVQLHQGNGYIWHATGSGKTLTSFKAAQNLVELPKVDKVIFVVDRADLDYQTTKEFNFFEPGSVDGTSSTFQLVKQLGDAKTKLVITTIQKLNAAISRDRYAPALQAIKDGRVVFIFDECHRSQFGETHRRIREFFSRAQLFGFTGTPIFGENAIATQSGLRTTEDLFGERLHRYIITNAIRDENVLRFSVEYLDVSPLRTEPEEPGDGTPRPQAREVLEHPRRVEAVVDWVIANHDGKTRNRRFGAIMAMGSVDGLILVFDEFERRRLHGDHDLKIATIFTYAANEDDPDANGLLPDPIFPDGQVTTDQAPKRDRLAGFVTHYNAAYGANESVSDGQGFYGYYRALAKRVKDRDRAGFLPEDGVDILLVVNMFLTGFDAKTVNTLYVDKNLRYHGLIQAFSRTNRILNHEKSHGNIVCFRDLKENTDDAIALFADPDAQGVVLIGGYAEHLAKFHSAMALLLAIVPDADAVDRLPDEEAVASFIKAFRDVLRMQNVLQSFSEYKASDCGADQQSFEDFRSKYLDLARRARAKGEEGDGGALEHIDFEIELLRRDEINVAYILTLLVSLGKKVREDDAQGRDVLQRRMQELLSSDPRFSDKKDLIGAFIREKLAEIDSDENVAESFRTFWADKRLAAYAALEAEEGLTSDGLAELLRGMNFSGKMPGNEKIVAILKNLPGALQRAATCRRILEKITAIRAKFEDHMGELESFNSEEN